MDCHYIRGVTLFLAFVMSICLPVGECSEITTSGSKICFMAKVFIDENPGWEVDCSKKNLDNIPALPSNTFILDMSFNNLNQINSLERENLTDLVSLNVSHNGVTELGVGCFHGLKHLNVLDLSSNNLQMTNSTYYPNLFKHLVSLKELFLHGNIQSFEDEYEYPGMAIGDVRSLEYLSIDGLTNKSFGREFRNLENLTTLLISGMHGFCDMRYVREDFFKYLPHLKNVTLFQCSISAIHESALVSLYKLQYLDIGTNMQLGFERMAKGLAALNRTLTLKHVSISSIHNRLEMGVCVRPHHVSWMKDLSLEYIDFSSNSIETFEPGVITSYIPKTLRILKIAYSRLIFGTEFAMEFFNKRFSFLEYLDASHSSTGIGKIDEKFPAIYFKRLHTVILSGNLFQSWIEATYLRTVTYLDLSHNTCYDVADGFFNDGAKIEYLDISRNFLGIIFDKETK